MSIIKVRSSSKWMKDNYGLYKGLNKKKRNKNLKKKKNNKASHKMTKQERQKRVKQIKNISPEQFSLDNSTKHVVQLEKDKRLYYKMIMFAAKNCNVLTDRQTYAQGKALHKHLPLDIFPKDKLGKIFLAYRYAQSDYNQKRKKSLDFYFKRELLKRNFHEKIIKELLRYV